MEIRELDSLRSVDELRAYQREVQSRRVDLDREFEGLPLPQAEREEYAELREIDGEIDTRCDELVARAEDVVRISERSENVERSADTFTRGRREHSRDIYDDQARRSVARSRTHEMELVRSDALRAVEQARFPHTKREWAQGHLAGLIERLDGQENDVLSRHVLNTGSPVYKRAFGKYVAGQFLTHDEERTLAEGSADIIRALSLTGSAGGFAVPFELDPTIIPTSNLAVNPYRAIARVEQITVDEWRGVSSAGITASYGAEATPTSDNAPTLAQPVISTEKAQAFVPFSIEVGMDWSGLQTEMANLLQDAKDELEATKFTLGTGTNEPLGIITGATTVFTAAATNALAVADIYGLEGALGPRFRPNAKIVMNRSVAQKIRQFDTAGGANLWVDNLAMGLDNQVPTPGYYGSKLLGYPAFEASAMSSAFTTGQLLGVLGDWRYFCIVDRIGLTVETIPHLFDVTNNRPTGQRGLYAYWRNSSGVLSANAFRTLKLA